MKTLKVLERKPLFLVGLLIIAVMTVLSLFPAQIATHDPLKIDASNRLKPPSMSHLLGTDPLGRDVFSRVVFGARISSFVGIVVVCVTAIIGSIFGSLAGYFGGVIDNVIMRVVDVLIAIPVLILAMVLSAAFGASLYSAVIAMIIVFCPRYIRLMRGQVLSVKNEMYTKGAKAIGARNWYIIVHYVIRNSYDPVLIKATLDIGATIMYAAALGFIGLGARPPLPEWGLMISHSRDYLTSAWWYSVFPGLAIFVTVLGWNFLGDGIKEIINPEERY